MSAHNTTSSSIVSTDSTSGEGTMTVAGVVRGAEADSAGPGVFLGVEEDTPGAGAARSDVPEQAALSWSTMVLSKDGVAT